MLLALLFIYAIAIPANSGALTSGMTLSAKPEYRGATMAMHSTVGFGLSAAGAWGIGVALDAGGGIEVLHRLAGCVSCHGSRRTYGPAGHLVVAARKTSRARTNGTRNGR